MRFKSECYCRKAVCQQVNKQQMHRCERNRKTCDRSVEHSENRAKVSRKQKLDGVFNVPVNISSVFYRFYDRCKVIICEIVKNAKKLLKLTLFDGLDERVIVSSIRDDYTPEELIGRKIIVIANLKPAKFAGVKSNGMLIAASGDDFGCKIIFVDDCVPEGTAIH